jgi:RNA recognition motif-containing protein
MQIFVPRAPGSKRPRGFAFVRYRSAKEAEEAIAREDGRQLRGRTIHCEMAKFGRGEGPSRPPPPRFDERRGDDRDRGRFDERGRRADDDRRDRGRYDDDRARVDDRDRRDRRSRSRSRDRDRDYRRDRSRSRSPGRDRVAAGGSGAAVDR